MLFPARVGDLLSKLVIRSADYKINKKYAQPGFYLANLVHLMTKKGFITEAIIKQLGADDIRVS